MKHTIDQVKAFDLSTYTGRNYHLYAQDGSLLKHEDTRDLLGEKAAKIMALKTVGKDRILAAFPEHKQLNAAMGLYSAAECQAIKDGVAALRAGIDALEQAILDAEDLLAVEQVDIG